MAKRSVSVLKRQRQQERRTERRKSAASRIRTLVRSGREAARKGDPATESAVRRICREIDKAASLGIIHRNAAARKKARLRRDANKFSAQSSR